MPVPPNPDDRHRRALLILLLLARAAALPPEQVDGPEARALAGQRPGPQRAPRPPDGGGRARRATLDVPAPLGGLTGPHGGPPSSGPAGAGLPALGGPRLVRVHGRRIRLQRIGRAVAALPQPALVGRQAVADALGHPLVRACRGRLSAARRRDEPVARAAPGQPARPWCDGVSVRVARAAAARHSRSPGEFQSSTAGPRSSSRNHADATASKIGVPTAPAEDGSGPNSSSPPERAGPGPSRNVSGPLDDLDGRPPDDRRPSTGREPGENAPDGGPEE